MRDVGESVGFLLHQQTPHVSRQWEGNRFWRHFLDHFDYLHDFLMRCPYLLQDTLVKKVFQHTWFLRAPHEDRPHQLWTPLVWVEWIEHGEYIMRSHPINFKKQFPHFTIQLDHLDWFLMFFNVSRFGNSKIYLKVLKKQFLLIFCHFWRFYHIFLNFLIFKIESLK